MFFAELKKPNCYMTKVFITDQKPKNFNLIYSKTENCQECPICLKTNENDDKVYFVKTKKCQHVFHEDCLKKWFTSSGDFTCPICRERFFL